MLETATFGGGCFWCTEAIFKRLKGVVSVVSGYSGGSAEQNPDSSLKNSTPTYDQVSTGTTGYAEAVQILFDPAIISYEKLLEVFFATHDPTTLNQQGADVGTQYRSVIFNHSEDQKKTAETLRNTIQQTGKYINPIVTEIIPFGAFYKAEDYHQNYYDNNKNAPYCSLVINPKLQKLLKEFKNEVKEEGV